MTLLHSLQFPGKCLYRMCLTLCAAIKDLSFFRRLGKILVLCFGKYIFRGKSPNMGRCIISYQEVLRSLLKNVNYQAHEAILCNQSINGQLLRTSVLTGCLCFGAL